MHLVYKIREEKNCMVQYLDTHSIIWSPTYVQSSINSIYKYENEKAWVHTNKYTKLITSLIYGEKAYKTQS